MSTDRSSPVNEHHAAALATFSERLRESERFHMGTGEVHKTLRAIARDLESAGIDYAIVGGMALNAHGYRRETVDVDVLVTPEGLHAFTSQFVGRGYRPAFEGAKKGFRNTQTNVKVEFLTTGEYPGDGKPKPVAFPEPAQASVVIDDVRVITLPKLIELKLASGMTNRSRRRDIADVQDLISRLRLDAAYAEQLDPYIRDLFLELVREVESEREREE